MKALVMNLASIFLILAIGLMDRNNSMLAWMVGGGCSYVVISLIVYASSIPNKKS